MTDTVSLSLGDTASPTNFGNSGNLTKALTRVIASDAHHFGPQFFDRDAVREAGSGRCPKGVIIPERRLLRRLVVTLFGSKKSSSAREGT